jgi:hypothetical protein
MNHGKGFHHPFPGTYELGAYAAFVICISLVGVILVLSK